MSLPKTIKTIVFDAFVSSNTWDVAGATAYGFYTIRLKRGEKPMDTMGFESSLEIDHLSLLI